VIHALWTLLQQQVAYVFTIKEVWALFPMVTELWVYFERLNYRKRPLVNQASQLAPFTTERQTELRLAVVFSKICLKESSV
jgi:hypothetical protein